MFAVLFVTLFFMLISSKISSPLKALPDKIIYISCSPQTLARDVGVLVGSLRYENGQIVRAGETSSSDYAISSVGVYDMFAQTKHVETLICLSRKTN